MDVVTGAVGSLICKLSQLLNEEYNLQKSVPEKLEFLIKELECAHAALRKVGGVPPDQLEENVKIWAREIRDASYDMEDEIDNFLVEGDGGHEEHSTVQESLFKRLQDYVGGLFGNMNNLFKRRKLAVAVNDINKRLEDVTQRRGRYTVHNITVARPAATPSIDPRLMAMYKEVTHLVGIEETSSELTAMLSTMKMVSIVGVGGLGKTTLAKSVYEKLKVDFECFAFVPVGRKPDLKKVFQDILREIDKKEYKKHTQFYKESNEKQLIDELRETFGNKRYLLVIDDVWETRSWEAIKLVLVQKNGGSRIITTTRILQVAKEAGEVYKLQRLPYSISKKLFFMRIFGDEGKCHDDQLDEVSDKILKKCDGVPLAIITMASLLVDKSMEEWVEVCSSIAFRDKENKQVSDTEWILSLSYYDLPPHLRTCLLYLSVFAEDQIIDKDSLILKWLAEGFVHNNIPGTSLFEVGNGYFNELINRSMIQTVEYGGMVVGCRVHDMMFDLLCLKSQEENFVTIYSNNYKATSLSSRVRRLIYQYQNKMVEHTQKYQLGHLRTFIAFRCDANVVFSFQNFKLLRVLALEHCFGVALKNLENLLHLRYLGLRYSHIDEIPKEIGALKFLQTLDMEGTFVKKDWLPSSFGLLTQLIYLRARGMKAPNGVIEKLEYLEQLEISSYKDTVGHFVKELGRLSELRVLNAEIVGRDHIMVRDLMESLGGLHKIWHLELCTDSWTNAFLESLIWVLPRTLRCLTLEYIYFSELPAWIHPSKLPNLTHLNLCVRYMHDQHLKILGQLPELRHLKLKIINSDNVAKMTVTSTASTSTITDVGCFQKLRFLSLPVSAVLIVLHEDSSILVVLNEDSSFSFTIGDSRTGTKRPDKCRGAPAVLMPNLQVLEFQVYLKGEKVNNNVCDNLGLDCLPSLERVEVTLWCFNADLDREKAALRQAIESHPNRPTLQMRVRIHNL